MSPFLPPADIAYSSTGTGNALLMLHGFCENHTIWDHVIPLLSDAQLILTPDIPGFGKSPLPSSEISLNQVAVILLAWLDSLDIDKFSVIGHSMGGYIALEMCRTAPERVAGFGLVHSTARKDSDDKKVNRSKSIDFIQQYGKDQFLKTFIPGLYHEEGPWVGKVKEMIYSTDVQSILTYTRAMRDRPDNRKIIEEINAPSVFIAGLWDDFVDHKDLESQARTARKSSYYLLENSAHLGMMEQPEKCAAYIQNFLKNSEVSF